MNAKTEKKRAPRRGAHNPLSADAGLLQQVLGSLTQGILLVAADGSITWANPAAAQMHGCAQAAELAMSAAAYRRRFVLRYLNHHKLTARQYPLARLAAGDPFHELTVALARKDSAPFERVLEMRGVLTGQVPNQTEAAALIIKDVTERASAEERFERAFASNPAPALILRTGDFCYIKANRGFLQMTGYTSDDVVGRSLHELDILHDAAHRDDALAALREHATIAQQESLLLASDGSYKFVIVAGQPIELEGEACMLFTFIDLDRRKRAENSLRASQESFSTAFRLAPIPMLICAQDSWRIQDANEAFVAMSGYAAQALLEQSLPDLAAGNRKGFPSDIVVALRAHTGIRKREVRLRTGEGAVIDCLLSVEPVRINEQTQTLCVVQDITERKRSEADLYEAIEAVMKDTSWFSRTMIEKLAQVRRASGSNTGLAELTPREREVLELICKGQTDVQIAATLQLSRHTVRNHVAALYGKIGVNRRSAAVIWGRERGLAAY